MVHYQLTLLPCNGIIVPNLVCLYIWFIYVCHYLSVCRYALQNQKMLEKKL